MFLHARQFKEEIECYERQNDRLSAEDLLRQIFKKRRVHQRQIEENEARIERLWSALMYI